MSKKTTVPTHDQIPLEATWDLTKIYKTTDEWDCDFSTIPELVSLFMSFRGQCDTPKMVLRALELNDEICQLTSQLFSYAHLKSDEDSSNSEAMSRLDKIRTKCAEIGGEMAWFDPELLALPLEKFKKLKSSPELSFYKRTLKQIDESRKHILSEKEESLLSKLSDVLDAPDQCYSQFVDVDMKFPMVKDGKGKKQELTDSNYIKLLESQDRVLRKNAFEAYYDTYGQFKHTFAAMLGLSVKTNIITSKIRNYKTSLSGALDHDKLKESIYTSLIQSSRDGLPELHKYFALRKKVLKLDKLEMYDIYSPLISECMEDVPWSDARKWVTESVKPLGSDYVSRINRAFDERWIDYRACKGKSSGAYSSSCYQKPSYILMNYFDNLEGVFTLAHELGHSMHSQYSGEAQKFHYAHYRIFVAEVASTTNELLLHHHLLQTLPSKDVKMYLLNHLINQIRGTFFRQTMFAEFEKITHEMAENSESLNTDNLCDRYYKLNIDYQGKHVAIDKRIEMEWARIPHFYRDFYVFKYATGISAAIALSQKILAGDVKPYIKFLQAGGSKDVLDILKAAGVDMSKPESTKATVELFSTMVNQLGKLLK